MRNNFSQEKIVRDIISIHERLSALENLTPSPTVNSSFSQLVDIVDGVSSHNSKEILRDEKVMSIYQDLRDLSARGESELERFWAKQILVSQHPWSDLRRFPYYGNYSTMIDFEAKAMGMCGVSQKAKILFVGAGPLPLSLIMLAMNHGYDVEGVDSDLGAVELSSRIIEVLGLSRQIRIMHRDVLDTHDLSCFQAVCIAALAGKDDDEKGKIIAHIADHVSLGSHVILRSVHDLGVLLYPQITRAHLRRIGMVRQYPRPKGVINSIIIGKTI